MSAPVELCGEAEVEAAPPTPPDAPAFTPPFPAASPRLRELAFAAVASTYACGEGPHDSPEDRFLRQTADAIRRDWGSLDRALEISLHAAASEDRQLLRLARRLGLSPLELLVVALAAAVENDTLAGRVLAHVQAPIGGPRPTLGLIAQAWGAFLDEGTAVLPSLLNGPAVRSGLLVILNETAPLPERSLMVPTPVCLALAGQDAAWPGARIGSDDLDRVPLPASFLAQAQRHARALAVAPQRALVLRTGSPAEGRSVAATIARTLRRRPLFIETDKVAGMGPWLGLRGLLPVFCLELSPGERHRLPDLPGYDGPLVVVSGPDGAVETANGAAASWLLSAPSAAERRQLWGHALGEGRLAEQLAREHRHGAGRIAHLGRLAQHYAGFAGRAAPDRDDVLAAAWTGEGSGLDSLAEPLRARVPDDALVAPAALRTELEALLQRCRVRDDLVNGLGASAVTRYRPGVRALLTGPSGTGKTLAAGWIATRLGLPLYRVDLASVTSKYIGETEKNLAQLLARAEQAEVILLFDEADSLFGKRTDISDANDRFANAQTNYLLQRIENYDGIVLLTSNSQARFDPAFTRRLDFTIDFPLPGPAERRALWESHLGRNHRLTQRELNQLAALIDFCGGHIRNTVLAAAVLAQPASRPISHEDIVTALGAELRKLGRQLPLELSQTV